MGVKVVVAYDPVWKALDWAKENCPSYITNSAVKVAWSGDMRLTLAEMAEMSIEYWFADEVDALKFALKWT